MNVFVRINSWDDLPHAISRMQVVGAEGRVRVLQALLHGRIAHLELQRTGSARTFKLWAAASRLPALALLGDDDHAVPDGPDTWPGARRVLAWARFILIHGGAGQPEHYEAAIALTCLHKRLVMIECSSANVEAWKAAAVRWGTGAEGLVMQPPPGFPHPSLDRGAMS